jgi:hypothetical protein
VAFTMISVTAEVDEIFVKMSRCVREDSKDLEKIDEN